MPKRKKPKVSPLEEAKAEAEAKAQRRIMNCASYGVLFIALLLGYALIAYLKGWQYKPDTNGFHNGSVFALVIAGPIGTFFLSRSTIKTQLLIKTFLMSLLWFMLGIGFLTYLNLQGFLACLVPLYIAGVLFATYKELLKVKDPLGIR